MSNIYNTLLSNNCNTHVFNYFNSHREAGKCQNWKVSELESVRIGQCQNWKVSELENVRIGKCQKYLEFKDSL